MAIRWHKIISFLAVALGSVAIVGVVHAQSPALSNLVERGIRYGLSQSQLLEFEQRSQASGLSDEQMIAILEPVVSLMEQNLPADHLVQKVFEGLSKRVPPQSVASLLARMAVATRDADNLVAPWMQNPGVQQALQQESRTPGSLRGEMIKGVAQGIQQGISAGELGMILNEVEARGILQRAGTSSVVAAVRILPDLSFNGNIEQSRSFLLRALESGFNTEEIQQLPAALNVAQQQSQLPASGVIEWVSNRLNSGVPAAEVLQNLLDGNVGGGPPGGTPPGLENNPGRGNGQGNSDGSGNPNPGQGNPDQNPGGGNGQGDQGGSGNGPGGNNGNPNPGGNFS